jgi:regulator of sirC expression with transglutaminase-like and TPR domain
MFRAQNYSARMARSALLHAKNRLRISSVEPAPLSPAQKAALSSLLDDTSLSVRRALLAHFTELGPVVAPFLQEISRGSNRLLARDATWFLETLKFIDPVGEFRAFIQSLHYELETGALLIARTVNPRLDVGECCGQLDAIAARCSELIAEPATVREKCRIMNRVLFHEWGFRGNVEHYTDPRNSFIDQVLTRRQGIPISLSLVYLLVAQRLDLPLEPVGLPGHFIVGCYADDAPFFVDPFDRGLFRDVDEIYTLLRANQLEPKPTDLMPSSVREVLCRACRNLVNHYTASGDMENAKLFTSFVDEFEATFARESA